MKRIGIIKEGDIFYAAINGQNVGQWASGKWQGLARIGSLKEMNLVGPVETGETVELEDLRDRFQNAEALLDGLVRSNDLRRARGAIAEANTRFNAIMRARGARQLK